jgi:hypothetical protein
VSIDLEIRLRLVERLLPTLEKWEINYAAMNKFVEYIKTGKSPAQTEYEKTGAQQFQEKLDKNAGRTAGEDPVEPEYTGEQPTPDDEPNF